jgi:ketosteroid isomerase-like protein
MSDRAQILFVNEAFYALFRSSDVAGMESLWAREAPVACIHPGWSALTTREEVMESWAGILANPGSPQVVCRDPKVFVAGDQGFVVCYEAIGDTLLVATNIFQRESGNWKLVHHQAGPCNLAPGDLEAEPEPGPMQ